MNEAVMLLARLEGLLFDPVYSGKGIAGMIDLIGKKQFGKSDNLLFIHTGGAAGLFAYRDRLKTA
jgi:L-cysteate sulfo-lyase